MQACTIEMNPSSSESAWYHVHHATGGVEHTANASMPAGPGPTSW